MPDGYGGVASAIQPHTARYAARDWRRRAGGADDEPVLVERSTATAKEREGRVRARTLPSPHLDVVQAGGAGRGTRGSAARRAALRVR